MFSNWEKAYEEGFRIKSSSPSKVAMNVFRIKKNPKNILDLGCGNGRNSVYAAKLGSYVDALDIVDLNFTKGLQKKMKERISFKKISVIDFKYPKNKYDIILGTRLVQYLDEKDFERLVKKISAAIKSKGILGISYTKSGGIFNKNYGVEKYSYSLEKIENLLKRHNFKIISIKKGSNVSTYVPYKERAEIYEIISQKN